MYSPIRNPREAMKAITPTGRRRKEQLLVELSLLFLIEPLSSTSHSVVAGVGVLIVQAVALLRRRNGIALRRDRGKHDDGDDLGKR